MLLATGQRSYPDGSARGHSFTSSHVGRAEDRRRQRALHPSIRHGMTYSAEATLARAREAFLQATAEAQELHENGTGGSVLADLLQHARELLENIRDEVIGLHASVPGGCAERLTSIAMSVCGKQQSNQQENIDIDVRDMTLEAIERLYVKPAEHP